MAFTPRGRGGGGGGRGGFTPRGGRGGSRGIYQPIELRMQSAVDIETDLA